jgi:hypothetical protein
MALTDLHPVRFAIAFLLAVLGCQQSTGPVIDTSKDLFFSSFESNADSAGWSGYGGWCFDQDAPPNGGSRSLRVAGGCIIPHLTRRLIAPAKPCSLSLIFWGKNLALGGSVSLRRAVGIGPELQVSVQDTAWTRYHSAHSIFSQPGDTFELEMTSGGIVYSAMRIDLIEVRMEEESPY